MKRIAVPVLIFSFLFAASCSSEHGESPASFAVESLPAPIDLTATAGIEQVRLDWDYPAGEIGEVREFRVYYYYETYDMMEFIDTTTDTYYIDSGLIGNVQYCYAVSAVDSAGMEGWRTDSVCAETTTGAGR